MNLISDAVDIGLGNIHKILDLWRAGKSDSLIDYTQPTRVEPIVLVDADCLFHDSLPDVMQSLLSTFAGYYLQAIALSATVGKVAVMRHLDRLNPRRSPLDSAADTGAIGAGWLLAQEAYETGLPKIPVGRLALEALDVMDVLPLNISMEAKSLRKPSSAPTATAIQQATLKNQQASSTAVQEANKAKHELDVAKREDTLTGSEFGYGKDTVTTLKELSNLSVGKVISVEITDGIHKAAIPVAIRLMASSLPSNTMAHMLSMGKKDTSVSARYHGWRSGRLEFWRDLVYCQDLIDAHRDNLMADKDGMYRQILGRKRKNTLAGVLSGNPSVATASNIAVISKETADKIELETIGNLNNYSTRQKLFEPTSLMIMAVISKEYDRVTFYYRGIPEKTEVSVRDLKAANKGSGPDIGDILKAYTQGHAPVL